MEEQILHIANTIKYLNFTQTSKVSLKLTINYCLEKVKRAIGKLNWLNKDRRIATSVLKQCLSAYVFPHLAWVFPLHSLLPKTLGNILNRKFRVAIRIVHRYSCISRKFIHSNRREVSGNLWTTISKEKITENA